jgi:hypothetical protein
MTINKEKGCIMLKKTCIALIVVLMMATVSSARVFEGVDMPETLQAGDYTLVLNGVGIRVVLLVVKPYVAGLYLMEAEKDAASIMKADEPMAIRLNMIDDATRSLMLSKLYDGMRNSVASVGGNFDTLKPRFDAFKELLPEPKFDKGSIFEFKYVPGKGLQVYKNGQYKGAIDGVDFKEAFFGIWLNKDKPADESIKTAWLAGDVSQEARDAQKQYSAKVKIEKESKMAEAEAKAKAVAEAQKKVEPEDMKVAEAEKEWEAEPAAMPKAPVTAMTASEKKEAGKAAEKMSAACPMTGDSGLAAAFLVNALKSAELTATLNGDPFDKEQETQNIIQLWKKISREISK